MDIRLIATQVGDLLKFDTNVNEIGRAASSIFRFARQDFPNDSITSQRAKLIYDWIMSLARQEMKPEEREQLLVKFCTAVAPGQHKTAVEKILIDCGARVVRREEYEAFFSRGFHTEVARHEQKLFLENNYFHAVFEVAKAYNKQVREKAGSSKDGYQLMMDVWGADKGVLKVTPCVTDTDKNVQDGIKFLSAGLMQAVRNPTAHEPAVDWPISKQDCLDILSFLSFLFRKLDDAVAVNP